MTTGDIVKWHKKEGDSVAEQDLLCEIQTDKETIALESSESGILAKIIAPDNTKDIPVGSLIALLVGEGEDWKNVQIPADAAVKTQAASQTVAETSAPAEAATASAVAATAPIAHHGVEGHLIGPSVKKLLQEYNIKSTDIPASGPAGALLKGDVLSYVKSKNLSKAEQRASPPVTSVLPTTAPVKTDQTSGANYIDIPLTGMRRTIARRLTESKSSIPHAYASIDSKMNALVELRKKLIADGVKISVNDFIIKAAAIALQSSPRINAVWDQNGPKLLDTVDISVAVATPTGLITPIVKGASYLSVVQISDLVKELSGRAKEGKLKPEEYQGGGFSISNLGMFGITEFTAVINPPQQAILAVGTSRSEASLQGNQLKMTVTLSYDSRSINEVDAARFLEEFRRAIEHPQSLLSGNDLNSEAEAFAF
ncbi:hypothetical protein Btru_018325 [Bulinus truncatus]|nr:hypothetical protein Btru_018325 [Bulinus truncatus]